MVLSTSNQQKTLLRIDSKASLFGQGQPKCLQNFSCEQHIAHTINLLSITGVVP